MSRAVCATLLYALFPFSACAQTPNAALPPISGEKALEFVRAQVDFGPRPPGSAALAKCREYLVQQLEGFGYEVERDAFQADTPYGPKAMVNLIARRKRAGTGPVVALASHYDTKYYASMPFVGANDGGSSTGLLLELARVLATAKDGLDHWFVFLDGEEAFIEWSTFDSTYGSRHLAKRWQQDGTAPRVRALILLDMIGDKSLDILRERNSTPWLMDLVWNTAKESGLADILSNTESYVEDDHLPFLDARIPCVDIIDMNYAPWHTQGDTLDKISAASLEKAGKLVLAVLPKLAERLSGR